MTQVRSEAQAPNRGDKIPGNRYIRDFCIMCKEPIRVEEIVPMPACYGCEPTCFPSGPSNGKIEVNEFNKGWWSGEW